MKSIILFRIAFLILLGACPAQNHGAGKAEHIVIVVWDGMRPDFIRPQYTPALYQLAERGVFFKAHHSVVISSTEVNGTAIITGAYPNHSGIMANKDYRPEIGYLDAGGTEALETIRRGDLLTGGHFIAVPTLTDIIQQAGFRTVISGTKPVALLLDRAYDGSSTAGRQSVTLYKGRTIPSAALQSLVKANDDKAFPATVTYPNTGQDAWTTRALTHGLWKQDVPKLSVLWMSDPDFSQHDSGPGSEAAIGGLESVDKNLASVLKVLEEKKALEKTDVFVVSDHGFSTIQRGVEVADLLKKAGFKAAKKFDDPESGEILVVGLGGSVALYVVGQDEGLIRKLVRFFQASDFAGVIFSRISVEGTFPLEQARLNTTNAPDLVVSFRWSRELSDTGVPGLVIGDGGKRGKGTHASLSPFDMRNTLIAAGPDFRSGWIDELPSGNADVAPTILSILGIASPQPMDGRVLVEALTSSTEPAPVSEEKTFEASFEGTFFHWHQYLKYRTVGTSVYFDEGNGESVLK